MKQFTDQRVDSTQFSHKARTQQVEQQIAILVSSIKRAARKSTVYHSITLRQYDALIVGIERQMRQWSVSKGKSKNYEGLKQVIADAIGKSEIGAYVDQVKDLNKAITEELNQLEKAQFLIA